MYNWENDDETNVEYFVWSIHIRYNIEDRECDLNLVKWNLKWMI